MKKFWLLIAAVAILSCKNEKESDFVVISGKIINNRGSEITFKKPYNKEFNETIKLARDGSFLDTLLIETGIYTFQYGRNRTEIFVEAGSNLAINFDSNNFENTLTFSGKGSEISTYLFQKQNTEKKLLGENNSIYILDEASYVSKLKEIKDTLEKLVSSSKGISNDFEEKEKRNLNYTYLVRLNNYQMFHSHYAKDPGFKTSDGFLKGLEEIKYDNEEDFLYATDYRTLVTSYYRKQASELARKEKIDNDIAFIKVVGALEKNTMKNDLIYERIKYAFPTTEDLEGLYKQFMATSTNETHKKEITESYSKFKTVVKGQPSPKFNNYENFAGKTTSLDDLKGNYVFINVWATWSSPNLIEMTFLKELETTYKGKNIKFVSISVDKAKDHDKWKSVVAENKFAGIQLFADKDMESGFVQEYLIKATPRYILIDPSGNIVNANAPRPSSRRLTRLFSELNI
ncbi:MAG: TlpA family protein disulfide reductase [Bacteroidetes bacterium HGW-Bacteroidetes-3]|jgi:thiol-disulfide isomerase/thioredoxin|nr:MAG: TlpA family protein disulfide reductase [Bacteroidetes bacterium HGW-Bacteroidetes-3]